MRKIIIITAAVLFPLAAQAADPPADPMQLAAGQTLVETLGQLVHWRARAIADERQIAELQKQLAAQKPAGVP